MLLQAVQGAHMRHKGAHMPLRAQGFLSGRAASAKLHQPQLLSLASRLFHGFTAPPRSRTLGFGSHRSSRTRATSRETALVDGMCALEGTTKVLHLYEDKDLELLEAVMSGTVLTGVSDSCDDAMYESQDGGCAAESHVAPAGVFVHSSIEMGNAHTPCVACASSSPGALVQGEFVFFLSTLVQVIDIRCAEHGGLDVTIRGEGRVRLSRLKQLNPYITGEVWPVLDVIAREVLETSKSPANHFPPTAGLAVSATSATDDPQSTTLQPLPEDPVPAIHHEPDVETLQSETDQEPGPLSDIEESDESDLNEEMCNVDDEGEEGSCLQAAEAEALDFPEGREQPYDSNSVMTYNPSVTPAAEVGGAAGAGWVLRAMVQELRQVTLDVHTLLLRMGQQETADQITAALQWADDLRPLMCNLGSREAAANLYLQPPKPTAVFANSSSVPGTDARQLSSSPLETGLVTAFDTAVLLPCAVSQLDRAVRLSFALLTLAKGAGGEGWTGGAAAVDPSRAALCTLDTRERLQIVITAAKSMRARLAAQRALRRLRHMT